MATDARDAGARRTRTREETAALAAEAERLKQHVVAGIRTAVPEVDRRAEDRRPGHAPQAIEVRHAGEGRAGLPLVAPQSLAKAA